MLLYPDLALVSRGYPPGIAQARFHPGRSRFNMSGMSIEGAGEGMVRFEAVIVPHRSLSPRGLRLLAGALGLLSAGVATGLWIAGAWPVIGFTGLEAALAIWLLRRHALGAQSSEILLLSDGMLRIVHVDPRGGRAEQLVETGWLRADLEERPGRTPALFVRSRGTKVEVAQALGEDEKRALASALQEALNRQRAPVFDNPQLRSFTPPPDPSI